MDNENAFLQQLAGALVVLMRPEIERVLSNLSPDFEHEIESAIESALPPEVEDQVYAQLDDRMADAIESALTDKLKDYAVTDARVEKAVADALPKVVRGAVADLFSPLMSIREDGTLVFSLSTNTSNWGA